MKRGSAMSYWQWEKKLSDYWKGKSVVFLRYAMGIVFFWFGMLKILGISPVDQLVVQVLSPMIQQNSFVVFIGVWEVVIGLCFFFKRTLRWALLLVFLLFPGTFSPLFINPEACFTSAPFGLTLEGQYILKNLVLIGASLVLLSGLHPKSERKR